MQNEANKSDSKPGDATSDAWEAVNHLTVRQIVTQLKLSGLAGSTLRGFTTPEGLPFVVMVGIGKSAHAAEQLFRDALTMAGTPVDACDNPGICQHCGHAQVSP